MQRLMLGNVLAKRRPSHAAEMAGAKTMIEGCEYISNLGAPVPVNQHKWEALPGQSTL